MWLLEATVAFIQQRRFYTPPEQLSIGVFPSSLVATLKTPHLQRLLNKVKIFSSSRKGNKMLQIFCITMVLLIPFGILFLAIVANGEW